MLDLLSGAERRQIDNPIALVQHLARSRELAVPDRQLTLQGAVGAGRRQFKTRIARVGGEQFKSPGGLAVQSLAAQRHQIIRVQAHRLALQIAPIHQ